MADMDRLRLLLAGLAAGDALGATSEFQPQQAVPRIYERYKADGWPYVPVGGGAFNWRAGEPTDDTAMALCIVRATTEHGRFDPAATAEQFVQWYKSGPRDIGGTTARTLRRVAQGEAWHDAGRHEYRNNPGGAANGSLMRNGVVPALASDLDEAFRVTLCHGIVTHFAPLPVLCCAVHTWMIWRLLDGDNPIARPDWLEAFDDDWRTWLASESDPAVQLWRERVGADLDATTARLRRELLPVDEFDPFRTDLGGRDGYCVLTLQVALWALRWATTDEPFPIPTGFPADAFHERGAGVIGWTALARIFHE